MTKDSRGGVKILLALTGIDKTARAEPESVCTRSDSQLNSNVFVSDETII